jgi:hypothetical protein
MSGRAKTKRRSSINLRLNELEAALLGELAKEEMISPSEWMRNHLRRELDRRKQVEQLRTRDR